MAFIELPKDISKEFGTDKFKQFCKHFSCTAKLQKGDWIIHSEDPVNFFWLGCNMTMQSSDSNLCVTIKDKILNNGK